MVAQLLIGALAKAHGPDDIPPLLADDPNDPFAVNRDPFAVLNLGAASSIRTRGQVRQRRTCVPGIPSILPCRPPPSFAQP